MGKGKVLVVDDQLAVRETMEEILKREGYQVASAEGSEQALEAMRKESFDVLLTDVRMPGMSGLDLVNEARKESPATISILITAYPNVEDIDQSIVHMGAYDYLLKPVRKERLCDAVAGAIRRKRITEDCLDG